MVVDFLTALDAARAKNPVLLYNFAERRADEGLQSGHAAHDLNCSLPICLNKVRKLKKTVYIIYELC